MSGEIIIGSGGSPRDDVGFVQQVNKATLAKQVDAHFTDVEVAVEKKFSKEDLERIHDAIRYTKTHLQAESFAKMDEEETLVRQLPGSKHRPFR